MTTPQQPVTAERDLLALDEQVCYALAVASRNVISLYRPILDPLGVTHPQYLVMLALWGAGGPLTLKELAGRLSLEPATLSPLLKRLEAIGLITRGRREDDERVLQVRLTRRGRELRKKALEVPPQVIERLGMSERDLRSLHAVLTRVIAATTAG